MTALATWMAVAAIAAGSTAPAFQTQDVMGRAIEVPVAGHPVLLCFEGRATAESAAKVSGELHPRHPELVIYNVIDLTSLPSLLRGYAKSRVAAKQSEAVKSARDAWRAAGKTPPADLDAQVHLAPQFDTKILALYGITDAPKHAHLVLVGADGRILGNWTTVPDAAAVEKALAPAGDD